MTRTTTLALAFGVLIGLLLAQLQTAATAATASTEIVSSNGVIVFMVNGQEQARMDASGLRVKGGIGYSGALTDTVIYEPASAQSSHAGGTP